MLVSAVRIDGNSFYISGSEFEFDTKNSPPPDVILIPVNYSLRRPKWADGKWVEGYREGIWIDEEGFAIPGSQEEYYGENTSGIINSLPSPELQNPRWNGTAWETTIFYPAVRVDTNGLYVPGSDFRHWGNPTQTIIHSLPPSGFWHPRWNGTQWVEGLTEEEIAQRTGATTPTPIYLTTDNANANRISYSPTPENSVLEGKTVQSALDETIIGIAELRSQLSLLVASNRPPAFYDALNDLNNALLTAHTPNTPYSGNLWTTPVGTWTIVSNQAKANGVSGSLAVYDAGFGTKGAFEADVTIANVTTPQGIIFRYASPTSYWRAIYSSGSGGKWMLQEVQGTSTATRASLPATVTFGQTYKFKVLLDTNNISFLVNEQAVCSWTAITNLTATKFGFYASSSTGTLFKNAKAVNLV